MKSSIATFIATETDFSDYTAVGKSLAEIKCQFKERDQFAFREIMAREMDEEDYSAACDIACQLHSAAPWEREEILGEIA